MRPEEIIEKRFCKKVEALGYEAIKFEIAGKKGAPDRIIFLPNGVTYFVEFKRPGGGVVSHHQKKFIEKMSSLGFRAEVHDNWQEPLAIIEEYLNENKSSHTVR